jgi:hypothetical protein
VQWFVSCLLKIKYEFNVSVALKVHIFWFFTKVVSSEVVHPVKIYQHAKFHGPVLTGASFAFTSEV